MRIPSEARILLPSAAYLFKRSEKPIPGETHSEPAACRARTTRNLACLIERMVLGQDTSHCHLSLLSPRHPSYLY